MVKYKLFIFIAINIIVGLIDGLGLAMFAPLLTSLSSNLSFTTSSHSLGQLGFLVSIFEYLGLNLTIPNILFIIFILFLFKGIARSIQVYYIAKIRLIIMTNLRLKLISKLETVTYSGYSNMDAGIIQNTFTTEISKLFANMTNLFLSIQNFIMLFTYLLLATLANWKFALLVAIAGILMRLFFAILFNKTKKASTEITNSAHNLNTAFLQAIINFKYLKATNNLSLFIRRIKTTIKKMEFFNFQMGKYQAYSEGLKEPLAILIICIIIYIQYQTSIQSINTIFVSLLLLYKSLINFNLLNSSLQAFYQSGGSVNAVNELDVQLEQSQEENTGNIYIEEINNLSLINLTIAYNKQIILNNISLTIQKNQTIAIIGESGAGKTTLINSIMGLITPIKGEILINNNSLKSLKPGQLNSKIGYISQDTVIFNESIYNNVTLYDDYNSENLNKFWSVIKISALTTFIENLTEGEQTKLGENGILISGGQKQRISIARELYRDIQILIMDEATSALDYETESFIRENIKLLKGKYTIIIIAHRLSTIKNSDHIYMLGDKKIIAHGRYEDLISSSNPFKQMIMAEHT